MTNPWGDPIWILTTPRTGSTWFSFLMNASAGLPYHKTQGAPENPYIFCEHFCEDSCVVTESPIAAKVMWHQVEQRQLLNEPPPGLRFIRLQRMNLSAQLASLMTSHTLAERGAERINAMNENQREEIKSHEITFNKDLAKHCLKQQLRWDKRIDDHCWYYPTVRITYEQLLEDAQHHVQRVLNVLRLPHKAVSPDTVPVLKLGSHPELLDRCRHFLKREGVT